MRDIEITDEELDHVVGFGTEKGSDGMLEVEKKATGFSA